MNGKRTSCSIGKFVSSERRHPLPHCGTSYIGLLTRVLTGESAILSEAAQGELGVRLRLPRPSRSTSGLKSRSLAAGRRDEVSARKLMDILPRNSSPAIPDYRHALISPASLGLVQKSPCMKPFAQSAMIIFLGLTTSTSLFLCSGCASTGGVERGRDGTIAYLVEIESSEPGARVEANGENVGKTPLTLKIFGDNDGTFHNFGSQQYVIQVFPVQTNQFVQTRVFRTGGWFSQEDCTAAN